MLKKTNIIIFMLLIIFLVILPACSTNLSQAEQEIEELKLEIAGLQEEIDKAPHEADEEISAHGSHDDIVGHPLLARNEGLGEEEQIGCEKGAENLRQ